MIKCCGNCTYWDGQDFEGFCQCFDSDFRSNEDYYCEYWEEIKDIKEDDVE